MTAEHGDTTAPVFSGDEVQRPVVAATGDLFHKEREFAYLVTSLARELHTFISLRLDGDGAEDVLNEVFLVVWRRWDDLPGNESDRRAWIYQTAKWTVKDWKTRERRRSRLITRLKETFRHSTTPSVERETIDDVSVEEILRDLPANQAQVVRLVAIEGLAPSTAAQVLGITTSAVTTRLSRARKNLQAAIAAREGGDHADTSRP